MIEVSLCIATYRRPTQLRSLLNDVMGQERLPDEVIVVDNDAAASARPVIDGIVASGPPFAIRYAIQPQKNISLTRNMTVELAQGIWLAFVDDDERAPADWLRKMLIAATTSAADGVLGPVEPIVPDTAPTWIKRGRFYDFPRMATGAVIPPNRLRFGNVLLRGSLLRSDRPPFDPAYGLTGGEDGDLLSRLFIEGARMIWCDEAVIYEPVESRRLSLRWLLRRSLSGGQDFANLALAGRYGDMSSIARIIFFLRALFQALVAACLALSAWPLGRHVAAHWLTKVSANLGKLTAFFGWRYREYS